MMRAVLLDESVLFKEGSDGSLEPLTRDVSRLLTRLGHSKLILAVLLKEISDELYSQKTLLLKQSGVWEILKVASLSQASNSVEVWNFYSSEWEVSPAECVYLTSQEDAAFHEELSSHGWLVMHLVTGNCCNTASIFHHVDEVPAFLVHPYKEALKENLVVVGYAMKWSRELDFLKRGAFPILPTKDGLSFIPLHLEKPLEQQLVDVDVILVKATDEIVSVRPGPFEPGNSVQFSNGIERLNRYLLEHPSICVVDPIAAVLPLLDRVAIQAILRTMGRPSHGVVRPPYSAEVTNFEEPGLSKALKEAKVSLPAIVKPRVACGTAEAHSMAIVFTNDGFKGLSIPLPATVQEYVDHGSWQYKMYVLGSKLFWSPRRSTPNGETLAAANEGSPVIVFDSLKSLPVSKANDNETQKGVPTPDKELELNVEAVQEAAKLLSQKLGLTIIGFDVVVQADTQDHVIIDVNFFPSFKDVRDVDAIPAFWKALTGAHCKWKSNNVK